jgi:hypothetical protein
MFFLGPGVLAPFHTDWSLLNFELVPFGFMLRTVAMVEEKMRYILTLALFFTCLSVALAADDPLTQRNNDAGTPVLIKSPIIEPPPWSQIERIRGARTK